MLTYCYIICKPHFSIILDAVYIILCTHIIIYVTNVTIPYAFINIVYAVDIMSCTISIMAWTNVFAVIDVTITFVVIDTILWVNYFLIYHFDVFNAVYW